MKNINEMVREYAAYKSMLDQTKAELEKLQVAIVSAMGTSDTIYTEDHKVTYKEIHSIRLDSKAIKAAAPDLYKLYSVESVLHRFTVA